MLLHHVFLDGKTLRSCSSPHTDCWNRRQVAGVRGFCPWHLLEVPYSLLSLFLLFLVPQMASDSLGLWRLLLTVQSPPGENSEWSGQRRFTFWTGQVEWGADAQHTGAFLLGRRLARGIRWRGATSGCSIWLLCRFSAFSLHCLLCVVTWVMIWSGSWKRSAVSMSCTLADSWIGQLQRGKRILSLQPSHTHRGRVLLGYLSALEEDWQLVRRMGVAVQGWTASS